MEWSRLGKFHQGRTGGRGGLIDGGMTSFIAKPPPHVAPDRGGERGLKDGGGRTKSQLCNRLGRAHLQRSGSRRRVHLCTRRSRRGHLWRSNSRRRVHL